MMIIYFSFDDGFGFLMFVLFDVLYDVLCMVIFFVFGKYFVGVFDVVMRIVCDGYWFGNYMYLYVKLGVFVDVVLIDEIDMIDVLICDVYCCVGFVVLDMILLCFLYGLML